MTIGAVEKTAPIARTVLSVILVNVARMVNVRRNAQTVDVEKTATLARPVRSAILTSVVTQITPVSLSVTIPSSLLQGLLSPV